MHHVGAVISHLDADILDCRDDPRESGWCGIDQVDAGLLAGLPGLIDVDRAGPNEQTCLWVAC